MSIDPIIPVPTVVAQLETRFAEFGAFLPSGLSSVLPSVLPSGLSSGLSSSLSSSLSSGLSSGLPSPSDPFSVLLDAATEPSLTSASAGGDLTTASVEPQLVSLASSSPSSGTGALATGALAPATPSGSAIVTEASKFLGVPYVWGGSSPSGFDCSGLVQYVFAQLGVELPRGSVDQSEVGTAVASLAEAQPGDLLFFEPGQNGAPPGEPGHVGIYIGNGQMIDAPETGETVQVQPVPCQPLCIRRVGVPVNGTAVIAATNASVQVGTISMPAQYAGLVEQASAKSGTPAALLAAILYNESRFQPDVISSAGAEGIAQFMPATAAANGVDPFDPSSAIPGAAEMLAQFHAAFGSWTDAIAAYAAGGGAVEAAGGVPQDGSTPAYVAKTLAEAGMTPGS